MHFIVTCTDKEGALDIRKANRDAHLAFAKENAATLQVGGPLLSDSGDMIGSCLICEADDKQALEAFLAQDPYAKAGLFSSVTILPWKWVLGKPE
ncbi:YciI family protein [uncultured Cohaesibacter sp.]|uniref:YciI family protein n=1 Tax=uncultured Cohaesibacter sp. TaxID=1002546 RepID=UPI00292DA1EA|nr:YciI family protein [uncultured Cohaesibacter sp.]